jgi:hypothetical protein
MARILGVDADPATAYLALIEDGRVLATPDRMQWPAGEESERLRALFEDAQAVLREQRVDRVAILLPQRTRRPITGYFGVLDRIALETTIRLAAVTLEIPVSMMDRATVRSRLDCGKQGALADYLEAVIPQPAGRYWNAGRGVAAMAALAAEQE